MLNLIAQLKPGKKAKMKVLRKNARGQPRRHRRHAPENADRAGPSKRMHVRDLAQFLAELAENNNRAWFVMNKPRYDILRAEFLEMTSQS